MRILLGISGGIAAYKTPELIRALQGHGHEVRCVATSNALRLVAQETLFTLSGNAVQSELWPQDGTIPHIETVRWCDAFLMAPVTANGMAKCALGLADDLLTTCYLAVEPRIPLFMAPAMNTVMWNKPIVQQHYHSLTAAGVTMIDPVAGNLACGEEGIGAMAAPQAIADFVHQHQAS